MGVFHGDALGKDLVEDFDGFGEGFAVVTVGVEEVPDCVCVVC